MGQLPLRDEPLALGSTTSPLALRFRLDSLGTAVVPASGLFFLAQKSPQRKAVARVSGSLSRAGKPCSPVLCVEPFKTRSSRPQAKPGCWCPEPQPSEVSSG